MKTEDHNSAPKPDSAFRSPVPCPVYLLGEIFENGVLHTLTFPGGKVGSKPRNK